MFSFNTKKNPTVYLFYGSQNGYAQSVAEHLFNQIGKIIINIKITTLNDFMSCEINEDDFVIILLSTTGDGEFPTNSLQFYKFIKKYNGNLKNINYSLLAFGDSNYKSFCHSSKILDRKFNQLGAKKFKETVYNDDAIDNNTIDTWINEIIEILKKHKTNIFNWFIQSINDKLSTNDIISTTKNN